MLYLSCWNAARKVHNKFLSHIFKVPMSFFDTTPIGRILSRFSKDIDILDVTLPGYFLDWLVCAFEV